MRNFGTFRRIPARRPQTVPRRTAQMIAIKQQQDRELPVPIGAKLAMNSATGFLLMNSDTGRLVRLGAS